MAIELPPPLPRALVHRTRLLDRLDAGTRGPLTIVSGPAGAGKTTLAADWARGRGAGRAPLWRDAAGADALFDELARARSDDPLVVVIDGLEASRAPASFGARLTALLRDRGARLRIVLCTRGEPPLPLGRARLDAEVVEIGPRELAFTWEEARALLAARLPDAAARERWRAVEGWAAGLERSPDALPAYLQRELLDHLAPQERALLLRLSVADELPPGLAAALAGGGGAEVAATLERLARAHALVVPLDRRGGGFRLAAPLRDALRTLLPVLLPGEREPLHRRAADWHAQAGDPLAAARHALAAGAPELAADVLAAHWLDLLARGRELELTELLTALPPQLLADDRELRLVAGALQGTGDAIARALDRRLGTLPAAGGRPAWGDRAAGGGVPAWGDGAARGGISAWGDRAARGGVPARGDRAAGGERDSMAATLAAARLRLARLRGDVAAAQRAAGALGVAADGGDLASRRRRGTLALQQLGVAELAAGDGEAAAAHLEQALGNARAAGLDHLAVACLGPLAALDARRGRLRSAQAWGEQALALAAGLGDARPAALVPAHVGLAVVAWQRVRRCAADDALRHAEALLAGPPDRSEAEARAAAQPDRPLPAGAQPDRRDADPRHHEALPAAPDSLTALTVRIPAAWLAAAGPPGDPAAELARLDAASAAARAQLGSLPAWLALDCDDARVRLLLALGRHDEADVVAGDGLRTAADGPRTPQAPLPRSALDDAPERLLLRARVALAREDAATARRLAERFLADAPAAVSPALLLEAMLLQARTAYELGTVWEALSWLERAIAAAAEEGWRRPFAEAGPPVRALLRVLARRGPWPPRGFVAELLEEPGTVATSDGDEPPLSAREQAVLRYLPSPLSKREIAGELGVSANTVKTHVSAIYRKLDVGSRTEAVARARELGLLGSGL